MIGLLLTVVLFPLVGWSVARRGWGEAFLFGAGLVGSILFFAGVLRVPLIAAFAAILLGSIGGVIWRMRDGNRADSPHPTRRLPFPTIVLAVPLIALAFISAITPLNDFDGRAFWVLKAKAIAHERSIEGPFFQGSTLDPRNHYPLLIPLDGAVIFALSHSLDDRELRWFYVGMLAALALFVRERIGSLVSTQAGAWCAALLVWLPQFTVEIEGGALSGYNDIALAAFAAGALFELVGAVAPRDHETATLPGREFRFALWLVFLVLTKSEGLPLALVFLLIGAVVFRRRIVMPASIAAITVAALFVWRSRIPAGDEENYLRMLPTIPQKLHNLGAALAAFPRHMFSVPNWGLFWIVVLLAAVVAVRTDRRAAIVSIAAVAAILSVYVGVYVATDWVVSDLIASTANRLLMHLIAPALLLLALAAQWTRTKSM